MKVDLNKLYFLLLLFCGLCVVRTYANTFPAQHFTIENGLPSNTVYDVYQDEDGFIWIGTDRGIARYNGRQFEIFTTADGLSDNECFIFKKDYYGRLWFTTYNGKLCFYKNGVFHNETNTPFLKLNTQASVINSFRVFSDSSIVFILNDDPGFYEIKENLIKHYTDTLMVQERTHSDFKFVDKTAQGDFIIYYSDEKIIYEAKNKVFSLKSYDSLKPERILQYGYNSFMMRKGNMLWTGDWKKVNLINPSIIDGKHIYKVFNDDNTKILATNKGIIFDGKATVLEEEDIYSYTKDKDGYYWIATGKNGIYKISSSFINQRQLHYTAKQTVIYAYKSRTNIFYATNDRNFYCLDMNTGKSTLIFDFTRTTHKIPWFKSVSWIERGKDYYSFSRDEYVKISGINKTRGGVVSIIRSTTLPGPYKKMVTSQYIYLQSANELAFIKKEDFKKKTNTINWHILLKRPYGKLYGTSVDNENHLWFSTSDKIYRVEDTLPVLQDKFKGLGFRQMIFFRHFLIGITMQNRLLISDNYNGENIYFKTINSNNCIWDKFYKINDTVLLISTNKYFRVLKIGTINDTLAYSLKAIENPLIPYQPEYLVSDSGYCYFFARNTLNIFPVSYLLEESPLPNVKFGFIKTADTAIYIRDTINLTYAAAQNIRVLFTAVSPASIELTYEYSISSSGKTEKWYSIDNEELNLIKLGYGRFYIKVRAKTSSGVYSKPSGFYLYIKEPYWASWWFIVSATIISLLVLSCGVYIWIKAKLKKKESDIAFLKSEYKYLNALMNPHFIFNSLNSVQGLVNNAENSAASKYIRIFSDLIRQNMHNISKDQISLEKEMQLVENYIKMEQLRLDNTLSYSIEIQNSIETDSIMIPPLIIQPLVENAIKHGIWPNTSRAGKIEIHIYEDKNDLFIDISDNGKGFTREEGYDDKHQSYALTNLTKRLKDLSMIHSKVITVSLTERLDTNGNVQGVSALITIQGYAKH